MYLSITLSITSKLWEVIHWHDVKIIFWDDHRVDLVCFQSCWWSLSFVAWYPVSENHCLMYFVQFPSCFRQEGQSGPHFSIRVRSGILHLHGFDFFGLSGLLFSSGVMLICKVHSDQSYGLQCSQILQK